MYVADSRQERQWLSNVKVAYNCYNMVSSRVPDRCSRGIFWLLAFVLLATIGARVAAQTAPPIDDLARRTADRVAKTGAQRVLIAPLLDCRLDDRRCEEFSSALRDALPKIVPSVQLVAREDVVRVGKTAGLLGIDLYNSYVLESIARQIGAQILVTMTLRWTKNGNELRSRIFDVTRRVQLAEFSAKGRLISSEPSDESFLVADSESGVSVLVVRNPKHPSASGYPRCMRCPQPKYTQEMLQKKQEGVVIALATITEQGQATDVHAIQSFSTEAAELTVNAVRKWNYKPAVAPDGKPFASRTLFEVTYILFRSEF